MNDAQNRSLVVLMVGTIIVSMLMGMPSMSVEAKDGSFGGGDGSVANPYVIEDAWDLQNMSSDLDAHYVLGNDIDASATISWNSGAGFKPIGNRDRHFTGVLDGGNFDITGLYIDLPTTYYVGLFGRLGSGGAVRNVGLVDCTVTGEGCVGGLIGTNTGGTVSRVFFDGDVVGLGGVGGLVGGNDVGTIADSFARGNVTGFAAVGGLVGSNDGTVANSHYDIEEVLINGEHHITIGGLFDVQYRDWYSNGLYLDISDYSASLVPAGDHYDISSIQGLQDLLGFAGAGGYKFRLVEDIDLTARPSFFIPYLSAEFDGLDHNLSNLRLDLGFSHSLGMFGCVKDGTIKNTRIIDFEVSGSHNVGGLAGLNRGVVTNSSAVGNATKNYYVGGLVGTNHGTVSNSYAKGHVSGKNLLGGLVGANYGTVSCSFAMVDVNGQDLVGGLVGVSWGMVTNSYAKGTVNGTFKVGGLVGENFKTVHNSYSTGKISGSGSYIGGLVGDESGGTVSNSFWDIETSNLTSSSGGIGKTTTEMKKSATFTDAGWDLTDTWCMMEDVTYPLLRWQDARSPVADAGPDQTVDEDTLVTFDGSGSYNDYEIVNYTWTFLDGTPVTLHGSAPEYAFDSPGVFVVTLNVTDAAGAWDTDEMTITVRDIIPPVAEAGPDQTGDEDTNFTLDGSGSSDNVGIVSWTWQFHYGFYTPDYESILLSGEIVHFTFGVPGIYDVWLHVKDAAGHTHSDNMTVTVMDIYPPRADAGPDQTIDEGTPLGFDGRYSIDRGEIVNYTWSFAYDGADIVLYGPQPSFTFDVPGLYSVELIVTDAAGHSDSDVTNVSVDDIRPPMADAGPDRTVDEDILVTLDGSGSFDTAGIASYTWTFAYGAGETVLHGVSPDFMFETPGIYTISLNVTDAAGHWAADEVTVTVRDVTPPVADAGADRTVPAGRPIRVDASASHDNVGVTDCTWTIDINGTPQSFRGMVQNFTFASDGVHELRLMVSDAAGNVASDTVVLTVVDRGRVTGRVLDQDGRPVEGASVLLTALNGSWVKVCTGPDGSFGVNPRYGPFDWTISKDGYRTISGNCSVAPMNTTELDLSDTPLVREDEGASSGLSLLMLAAIVILLVIGIALVVLMKKKGRSKG